MDTGTWHAVTGNFLVNALDTFHRFNRCYQVKNPDSYSWHRLSSLKLFIGSMDSRNVLYGAVNLLKVIYRCGMLLNYPERHCKLGSMTFTTKRIHIGYIVVNQHGYLDIWDIPQRLVCTVLSFFLYFSLPDVLYDPTDVIWIWGTPFEAMTGRTVFIRRTPSWSLPVFSPVIK